MMCLKRVSWKNRMLIAITVSAMLLSAGMALHRGDDYSSEPIWIYDSDLSVRNVETADLSDDGVADVIAGEYNMTYYGEPSLVIGIDGVTGATLWTYLVQDGIRSMTIGDVNNDGVMDAIAGAAYNSSGTPDGKIHAIDGTDGTGLWAYPVGETITDVCMADLNGDAYMDVAAGSFDDNVYGINGETGALLWQRDIASLWINAVDAADVNGDDIDDIAYANEYLAGWDNRFGVLDGTDGSFIWDSTVEYLVMDALLEDIDGDGQVEAIFGGIYADDHGEIFVRNGADGSLEWSYNIGPVDHSNGNILLRAVDIDETGDLELIVATYLGTRQVFAFEGDVNVARWVSDPLDGHTRDLAFADLTGDKDLNIVAAGSDRVEILNALDGAILWYYSVAGSMWSVACADFDGDEVFDIAAGGTADEAGTPPNPDKSVWALKTILSPVLWEYDFGEYGNGIALGDFSGDGCQDVVAVASLGDNAVAVDGVTGGQLWLWQGTQNLYTVTTGDFDGNGQIDAAVAGADDMVTAINGSDGSTMWQFTTPTDQIYRKCLAAADLNGDGNVDVVAGADDNMVYAIRGENGAQLWAQNVGGEVDEVDLAQMDNAGPLDVVVAVAGGPDGEKVVVLDGIDGSVLWSYAAPAAVSHVEPMDVNDDGIMDVAAGITPFSTQVIMINGATQSAIWSEPMPLPSNIMEMGGGDLNMDKIPDVLVPGNSTDRKVYAMSGDDGHIFWEFPTGGEVNHCLVYDVDNDGVNEAVVGSDDQNVYVLNGLDGSQEWNYSTAGDVMHVLTGDVNCNDRVNIVCVTFDSDGLVYAFRTLDETTHYICGDANGDTIVNVADAVFLINYVFKSGPPPDPLEAGDANCDLSVNVADAVYIISYVFKNGPAPCCP